MLKNTLFFVSSLMCLLFIGCVSSNKNLGPETQTIVLQQELKKKNKELENMERQLKDMEAIRLSLSNRIRRLELETKKRDAIIQLQGKVIKLFDDTQKTIQTGLKDQIDAKLSEIEKSEGKDEADHNHRIFFDSGSIKINKRAQRLLLKLADAVRENKNQNIVVEGHTDKSPEVKLPKPKFSKNWEFSTARAVAVVRFFQEEAGLEPERLSAVGYGSHRPIASNDTEEGRRQNRRVEIILAPPI